MCFVLNKLVYKICRLKRLPHTFRSFQIISRQKNVDFLIVTQQLEFSDKLYSSSTPTHFFIAIFFLHHAVNKFKEFPYQLTNLVWATFPQIHHVNVENVDSVDDLYSDTRRALLSGKFRHSIAQPISHLHKLK